MTLLDKLLYLMRLRGLDTTYISRVDQAVDALIEAEKPVAPVKVDTSPKEEPKSTKSSKKKTEEHVGI